VAAAVACGGSNGEITGVGSGGPSTPDAGSTPPDAGIPPDAGSGTPDAGTPDAGGVDAGTPDAGGVDAGTPDAGGVDAGTPDAGGVDAGMPDAGGVDAGMPDAGGVDAGPGDAGSPDGGAADGGTIVFPNSAGWTFYGPQNGGPPDVYGVTTDEGGNVWVAGGADGLFLMRNVGTAAAPQPSGTFEKFGLSDGLHPYGYLNGAVASSMGVSDGSPADLSPDLAATPVISVAGGPAGVVYVGYQGRAGCESAWNWQCAITNPDGTCAQATDPSTWGNPALYKSGDADRVTLSARGISVVHYDVFSGPNVVKAETGGRERLCSIFRLVWDKAQDKVWVGANHGFAVLKASYAGDPTCNGEYPGFRNNADCTGVYEHSHPAINACATDSDPTGKSCPSPIYLTDDYYGVSIDPATKDVWFGGLNRSTIFHYGTYGGRGLGAFYGSQIDTEAQPPQAPGYCTQHNHNGAAYNGIPCGVENRLDLWKDAVPECTPVAGSSTGQCTTNYPGPANRTDDAVSGMAATGAGQAWVSSFAHGLVQIDTAGEIIADARLPIRNLSSLALDQDGSVWAGTSYGYGLYRYRNGSLNLYWTDTFGAQLANARINDLQKYSFSSGRWLLVAFRQSASASGAIGIYSGP